ncbi:hypothetical protein GCM10022207_85030 [Streptomyces lannensis]|uniref:Transposase n=3 Tax=Streptomyces TaxID=1883 RepID=A0ABP7LLU5_9ACTN
MWKLWEKIVPLGYKGSCLRVGAYPRKKRTSPGPVPPGHPRPGRSPDGSSAARKHSPRPKSSRSRPSAPSAPWLETLTRYVRSFATTLSERQRMRLPERLDAVRQDDMPSLLTLAAGIDRDINAVITGLTMSALPPDQNAQGQMFGRAGFALLRSGRIAA